MKGIIWAAVSSKRQAEEISIDNQIELGKFHAGKYGIEIVDVLIVSQSRKIILWEDAREVPAYDRLYQLVRNQEIDVLFYYNQTRLARETALGIAILDTCHSKGIITYELQSPPNAIEDLIGQSSNIEGHYVRALKQVGSKVEVMQISKNNEIGMKNRAKKGLPPSILHHWMIPSYNRSGRIEKIELDPAVVDSYRYLLLELLVKDNLSPAAAAARMNSEGVPYRGGKWHRYDIDNLLRERLKLAGYVVLNNVSKRNRERIIEKAIWPQMISDVELSAIERYMEVRATGIRGPVFHHSLRGAVYCTCGTRMTAQVRQRKRLSGLYFSYQCRNRHNHIKAPAISCTALEEAFEFFLDDIVTSNDLSALDLNPLPQSKINSIRERIIELEKSKLGFDSQIQMADSMLLTGRMTEDRHQAQINRISKEIGAVEKTIEKLLEQIEASNVVASEIPKVIDAARLIQSMLGDESKVEEANRMIRSHFRIWVSDEEVRIRSIVSA